MPNRVAAMYVSILLALILGGTAVSAAELPSAKTTQPCSAPTPAACRYAKGLLWKIERTGRQPSYLFGTIHIADPRVTTLPVPVRETFDAARSFTMELIADGAGLVHMAETMFFNDGRTLEGTIGGERYAAVRRALTARGVPVGDLNQKKPWVVVMLLSVPAPTGVALDLQLQVRATLQGKPTHGLESMHEQIAVFNDLSMADQVALLDNTLRYAHEADKLLEAMVQAYVARDLARVMAIMDSSGAEDARLRETVTERLLASRNVRMLERMRPRLDDGNAFIAVGAAHLPGERGLLTLLEQAGYRLTPLY